MMLGDLRGGTWLLAPHLGRTEGCGEPWLCRGARGIWFLGMNLVSRRLDTRGPTSWRYSGLLTRTAAAASGAPGDLSSDLAETEADAEVRGRGLPTAAAAVAGRRAGLPRVLRLGLAGESCRAVIPVAGGMCKRGIQPSVEQQHQ